LIASIVFKEKEHDFCLVANLLLDLLSEIVLIGLDLISQAIPLLLPPAPSVQAFPNSFPLCMEINASQGSS
jgi:hypothetical protein